MNMTTKQLERQAVAAHQAGAMWPNYRRSE